MLCATFRCSLLRTPLTILLCAGRCVVQEPEPEPAGDAAEGLALEHAVAEHSVRRRRDPIPIASFSSFTLFCSHTRTNSSELVRELFPSAYYTPYVHVYAVRNGYMCERPTGERRRLSANRWACDCRLGWLARWLRTRRQAVETDAAVCSAPAVLAGSQLADLADIDFQCSSAPPHADLYLRDHHSLYYTVHSLLPACFTWQLSAGTVQHLRHISVAMFCASVSLFSYSYYCE